MNVVRTKVPNMNYEGSEVVGISEKQKTEVTSPTSLKHKKPLDVSVPTEPVSVSDTLASSSGSSSGSGLLHACPNCHFVFHVAPGAISVSLPPTATSTATVLVPVTKASISTDSLSTPSFESTTITTLSTETEFHLKATSSFSPGSEFHEKVKDTQPITLQSPTQTRKSRENLPRPTTDALRSWLLANAHHPYPSDTMKRQMARTYGLSVTQVNNWFINARRRVLWPTMGERKSGREKEKEKGGKRKEKGKGKEEKGGEEKQGGEKEEKGQRKKRKVESEGEDVRMTPTSTILDLLDACELLEQQHQKHVQDTAHGE